MEEKPVMLNSIKTTKKVSFSSSTWKCSSKNPRLFFKKNLRVLKVQCQSLEVVKYSGPYMVKTDTCSISMNYGTGYTVKLDGFGHLCLAYPVLPSSLLSSLVYIV